jgi:hypothetical protein
LVASDNRNEGREDIVNDIASPPVVSDRVPLHVWIVGFLGLIWNAIGAFDYVMTETHNAAYLAGLSPEMLEYIENFPAWAVAVWALAVWGGVVGSILLLLRKRAAVWVFGVSLVAMVLTTVYQYGLSKGLELMPGAGPKVFTAVIFVIALGLFLYTRALARKRILN